jgi:hypothetical protein
MGRITYAFYRAIAREMIKTNFHIPNVSAGNIHRLGGPALNTVTFIFQKHN